ncbi:AAA family ATPase [Hyphomicrobium sp. MC8b]|uniref:AAA family ATPase n=1 Tax=Hyphomicrobium sp. MC8b TaxID=300273 RepID=UPI00391A97A1
MHFRVKIKGFRAFRETGWVRVRPITLLIGENSTGKTSFLAALRYMLKALGSTQSSSFNQEPFYLGAYDQIAHYRKGAAGRARCFQFGIEFENQNFLHRKEPLEKPVSLVMEFKSKSGQPVNTQIEARWNHASVHAELGDVGTVEINDDGRAYKLSNTNDAIAPGVFRNLSLDTLRFVLTMAPYFDAKEGRHAPFVRKAEQLGRLLTDLGHALDGRVKTSSPVRTRPERTYQPIEVLESAEGSDTPLLLARMNATDKAGWARIEEGISTYGKASGLFENISIKRLGRSASDPFQIIVKGLGAPANLIDVGYGVSQILPLLTDLLASTGPTVFLHQQPEIHLHPTAQAALGSLFGAVVKERHHTIVAETHSDYILDRLRMDIRDKKTIAPGDMMILYFSRNNSETEIHEIEIDENGMLIGTPPGYREFFIREQMRSLWE